MGTVISKDGTRIAFDQIGTGPALILIDGAMSYRGSSINEPLARLLADTFTVYTYDRRGRGESSDTLPYAVDREVEDLEALITHAGGSAFVYGVSSGAALALQAAHCGLPIKKLVLYEAPLMVDSTRKPLPADYLAHMKSLVANEKRGDAVKYFMGTGVGLPWYIVMMFPLMPAWGKLKAVAHTLPYDALVMDGLQSGKPLSKERWAGATLPTLVMDGGKSDPWMRNGTKALSDVLPNAQYRTLPGETHIVNAESVAPVLKEFFK